MDVVKKIGDTPTGAMDRPKSEVVINSLEIRRG
jgi:hypothetical protein